MGYPWKVWFWGDSIGMEGLLDASELTGIDRYRSYVYGVLKGWIPRMGQRARFDHTAPGVALLRSYALTGDPQLLEAARAHAEYLAGFRRTSGGCPVHYEDVAFDAPPELPSGRALGGPTAAAVVAPTSSSASPRACVFVDSVHFQGPFLAMLHALTGEARYLAQAESTIGPQVDLLWDERERLFHHFWVEETGARNGVFWGRGNGWGLLGMLHTLEHLPEASPLSQRLRRIVREQASRLAELQDGSGDWHTVLDDRRSYLESSVAAFVVDGFSLAIRRGWLPGTYREVVEKGWRAMWTHLGPDGLLRGVSFETHPGTRPEHYREMPTGAMVPWGQGPFLAACRSYLASSGQDPR
jgi:unsaturated rhamnogalacturonyl hydrolase